MIIDEVDTSDLDDVPERAFIVFEERLSKALDLAIELDAKCHYDINGNYTGSFSPHRDYVTSVMGFLHEYGLKMGVTDISNYSTEGFPSAFNEFCGKINYSKTRFKLRHGKHQKNQTATAISIQDTYKDEIYGYLNTIRKIVNSNVRDENKKDAIFKKIAQLQSEIDRNRTTIDAVFGRVIELSQVLGRCAENMEPAIQKLERVMAALRDGSNTQALLSDSKNDQKLIQDNSELQEDSKAIPF